MENELTNLAREKFGELNPSEKTLFESIANMGAAIFNGDWEKNIKGPEIRANRIVWLLTDHVAKSLIPARGIEIHGATIKGSIDLEFSEIESPIVLYKCHVPEGINIQKAKIIGLYLTETSSGPILASGANIADSIFLRKSTIINGEVNLNGTSINGMLDCTGGKFINPKEKAINALSLFVGRNILMHQGFLAEGEVDLRYSTINGNLVCDNGIFKNEKNIPNSIRFALLLNGIEVKGDILLRSGFKSYGGIYIMTGNVQGQIVCNGEIINPGGPAIIAPGLRVSGAVLLQGFKATGEVSFVGAIINGQLSCVGSEFNNEGSSALLLNTINVKNDVFLSQDFKAIGEVRLVSADIGGNLYCNGGSFFNEDGYAILADGMRINGSLKMSDGFHAKGKVSLIGVNIIGQLTWYNIVNPDELELNLQSAKVKTLCDDKKSWPASGNLILQGFEYEIISDRSPLDYDSRIFWINLQSRENKGLQPYEQLANVFLKNGMEREYKKILIEKNKTRYRNTNSILEKAKGLFLRYSVGYGYETWKLIIAGLIIIAIGWGFYGYGDKNGLMVRTKPSIQILENIADKTKKVDYYPKKNWIVYSIDTFIPIIDLNVASFWMPDRNKKYGTTLWFWYGIEKILGWVIISLYVVSLSGILKN